MAFIGFGLFAIGCSGYAGPRTIANPDPAVKIPEIKAAVIGDDRQALPQFVEDLDSEDAAIRFYSIQALRRMTDETFGYDWTASDRFARAPAIARWKQYVTEHQ